VISRGSGLTDQLENYVALCCAGRRSTARHATARHDAQAREYLEKNYEPAAGAAAVKLCVKALAELLEASGQTIEVTVVDADGPRDLTAEQVDAVVKEIEDDAAAAEAARKAQAEAQAQAAGGGGGGGA
jgi:hypothetical protein